MKKKVLALTLALTTAFVFTACGQKAEPAPEKTEEAAEEASEAEEETEETSEAEEETATEETAEVTGIELSVPMTYGKVADTYDEVIKLYQEAMKDAWSVEAVTDMGLSPLICYYAENGMDTIGFNPTFDFDYDGTPELIIGEIADDPENPNYIVFAAYTLKDDGVYPVFISSERSRFYLTALLEEDPFAVNIVWEGSNSAFESIVNTYNANGSDLELLRSFVYNDQVDSENPWFEAGPDGKFAPVEADYATEIIDANASHYVYYGYLTIDQGYFVPDPEVGE